MNSFEPNRLTATRLYWLHLFLVVFYATPLILEYPISFALYAVICRLIFGAVLGRSNRYVGPFRDTDRLVARILVLLGLGILVAHIGALSIPNFYALTLEDKIQTTRILPRFVPAFFFVACLILGDSTRTWDKILATALLVLLFLESQSTSRGGILLTALPLYLIWRRYTGVRIAAAAASLALILFFVEILYVRLGVSSLDVIEFLLAERQADLLEGELGDGLQPEKWKIFAFFLPAIVKGEWLATNYYISEAILGVSSSSPLFFVITTGDFGVYRVGYGTTWPIFAAFGVAGALVMFRWLCGRLPSYSLYFALLFLLIGSRAGTESLLTVYLHGSVLPVVIINASGYLLSKGLGHRPNRRFSS